MSKTRTLHEIVQDLCGPVSPIGATHHDERRLENLKDLIELVDRLVFDIAYVAREKGRQEHSVQRAGKLAYEALHDLYGSLEDFAEKPKNQ